MTLTYGSLFSGIGGADLGFDRAGLECRFQVEIDKQCLSVLKRHWPDVPKYHDVKEVDKHVGAVDVLVGGFPCQDVSLAGRRNGLAGQRSGLFFEFMRVAAELSPRWLLIENVPGLLSSNDGRDMGAVLGEMGNLGYGYAYRVLDSQYFGLAQRRKRVFLVGHLGEPWSASAKVLFERESSPWDSPPRRTPREEAPALVEGSPADDFGSGPRVIVPDIASTLGAGTKSTGWCDDLDRSGAFPVETTHEVSPCLQERAGKGADSDCTQAYVIAYRKASRSKNRELPETWVNDGIANTLNTFENTDVRTTHAIVASSRARRLTPLEYERLQGFPDGWTDGQVDSPRYKQLGNAISVLVAQWLGERIINASSTSKD